MKTCSECKPPPAGNDHDLVRERQMRLRDRVKQRDAVLRTRYGITAEDWDRMFLAQDGRCAVCRELSDDLRVDHCHDTGRVRGLLCHGCNIGLGVVERPGWLDRALAYIKE